MSMAGLLRNFFSAESWSFRSARPRSDEEFGNLARLHEQKTALLFTASHEVRGSLHGIFGLVEQLRDEAAPSSNARLFDALADACSGLQTTVQQVLDVAQLETGHGVLQTTVFDLRSVLREVGAVVAGTAGPDVFVRTSIDDACSFSRRGDAGRVNQILTNIATNGVKAMHRGVLTIKVIELSEGIVRFTVRDEGVGMPAFARNRLVSPPDESLPFTDRRQRTGDRRANSGLGLLIARELIESLDGRVDVSVARSAGTVVQIDLPLPMEHAVRPLPTSEHENETSIGRALVVDDAPDGLQFLAHSLRAICDSCDATVDSEEALSLAAASHYDLVILDGMMSPHDGADLSRALRRFPTTKHSVIIVATGNVETVSSSRYLAAGADLVLVKPFSRGELVRAVRRTVAARSGDTCAGNSDDRTAGTVIDLRTDATQAVESSPGTVRATPLDLFYSLLDSRLQAIRDACNDGDTDAFVRASHALGSAAVVMGVDRLGRYCLALETISRSVGVAGISQAALDELTVLASAQRSASGSSVRT